MKMFESKADMTNTNLQYERGRCRINFDPRYSTKNNNKRRAHKWIDNITYYWVVDVYYGDGKCAEL